MIKKAVKVLLIEKETSMAKRINSSLSSQQALVFQVAWVKEMTKAVSLMDNTHIDVVLLDLSVSNGQTADFVEQLLHQAPNAIIILLCNNSDKAHALEAMALGAYDCVDKNRLGHNWIKRVLGYNLLLAEADKLLSVSEATLRALGNASPLGMTVSDIFGNTTYTNSAYQAITGFSPEQTLGQHWSAQVHPLDRLRLAKEWQEALQDQQIFHSNVRLLREDDSTCRVRMTGAFIKDDRKLYGHVRTIEDLTDRSSRSSSAHSARKNSRDWLPPTAAQMTLDVMADAVLSKDLKGKVKYLNQAAERLTGWKSHEAVGQPLAKVFNLRDRITGSQLADSSEFAIAENQLVEMPRDCVLVRKDGVETMIEESATPIKDEMGNNIGAVLVFRDVTQSRVMTIKMTHLAQHDVLTGLPNRQLFQERLNQAMVLAKRHEKLLAVLYLDIDLFKNINDIHGHKVGDKLLCSIADRMSDAVRHSDTVCRQGGDEFVVLLSEIEDPNDAAKFSTKLLTRLAEPHLIEGKEISVSMSIGIGIFPTDSDNSDVLLDCADTAMFQAKSDGRNCYQFYKQSMNINATEQSQIESRLKRGLMEQEFVVHYQPQFDLNSGEIIGAEALIRWQDPEMGLLYPAEFIRAAEHANLICTIGEWMRRQVCQQQKIWQDKGLDIIPVTVNTSASELSAKNFLGNIKLALKDYDLAPWCLGLEVSEKDMIVSDYPVISQLKGLGVQLGLDDVGLGAGKLSYSQYLNFDTVKIAPKVIYDAVLNSDNAKIATAVISLSINLGQKIVAKSIESQQQLAFLNHCKCTAAQGYFFKYPMDAEHFGELLGVADTQQRLNN